MVAQAGGGGGAYYPGAPGKRYVIPGLGQPYNPGPPKYNASYAAGSKAAPRRPVNDNLRPNAQRRPAPPRRPTAPRVAPRSSVPTNTTPSSNGYRSGKAVGSNPSGTVAKTAPAVTAKTAAAPMTADQIAKTFNQWSGGDAVYKAQRDALSSALNTYNARAQKEATDYGVQNTSNRNALVNQETQSNRDLVNDYTARGMLGGAQNYAQTQFNTDWNKRLTDFDTSYADWQNQQKMAGQDYAQSNALQLSKAQQDAIARRVASYGL